MQEGLEWQDYYAMSSCNHPLMGYAPMAQQGTLMGNHRIKEAVKERLPPLLDPARSSVEAEQSRQNGYVPSTNRTGPKEVGPASKGVSQLGWMLIATLAISIIALLYTLYRHKMNVTRGNQPVAAKHQTQNGSLAKVAQTNKALPQLPHIAHAPEESGTGVRVPTDGDPHDLTGHVAANGHAKKNNLRRRKRGKKGKAKRDQDDDDDEDDDDGNVTDPAKEMNKSVNGHDQETDAPEKPSEITPLAIPDLPPDEPGKTLVDVATSPTLSGLSVTEDVIGFGSHGTMVYKGVFQGRAVAVKRLLRDFVSVASQEVALLQASDDHQNVIRCESGRVHGVFERRD